MIFTKNGVDFYAYTATHDHDDARDTVVFVHGTAMDHSVWAHQSRYFGYHGFNVAAVDLPGHGKSGGGLLADIGELAVWLNGVVGELPARGFHLVGHSMGALIALETAANFNHNAKLNSLTLIGFAYPMKVSEALLTAADADPPAAHAMMTQWSHASPVGGEPVPGFWSPGMQRAMMANNAPAAVSAGLRACDDYAGGEAAFAKVACPTLFVCGALDKMAPAKLAQAHADKNHNAEIVFIPRCGHSLLAESPDGILRELKRFVGAHQTT